MSCSLLFRVQARAGKRETKTKCGSLGFRRFEFYRTVVPLQDLVSLRQADAVAVFLGGEIKLKDFVLYILRNACTLIANLGNRRIIVAARRKSELASVRHGLDPVKHYIEQGLLDEIEVRFDGKRLAGD